MKACLCTLPYDKCCGAQKDREETVMWIPGKDPEYETLRQEALIAEMLKGRNRRWR